MSGQHHRTPSTNLHCTARGRPTAGCCFAVRPVRLDRQQLFSSRPVPVGLSACCVRLQRPSSAGYVCLLAFAMPCPLPFSSFAPVQCCFAPCSFHVRQDQRVRCTNCPVGSYNTGLQWRPVCRFLTFRPFSCRVHDPGPWFNVKFISTMYCAVNMSVRPRHVCLSAGNFSLVVRVRVLVVSGSALRLLIFGTRIH